MRQDQQKTTDRIQALIDGVYAIDGHELTRAEAADVLKRIDAAQAAAEEAERRRRRSLEFMQREAGYHVD